MTNTYNTGNPIGSTSPKDLADNASNFDQGLNTTGPSWVDRFGKKRQSFKGFELAAEQSLLSTGYAYTNPITYQAGIVITRLNQIFLKDGEYYRLGPALSDSLPYTTTGNWTVEGPQMLSVGDAVIRSDLLNLSKTAGKGTSLITFTRGTAQRSLSAKLGDVLSARDAGAVGDGVTNDTAAVVAALASGKSLYFPAGVYLLDYMSLVKSGQRIYGEGLNTVLKCTAAATNTFIYVNAGLVEIDTLQIDTTLAGSECITVYADTGSASFKMTTVRAAGVSRMTYYATGAADVSFIDCYSNQARDNGIQFYNCARPQALYCDSRNVQNFHGIQAVGCVSAKIFNCKATACGTFGINSYNGEKTDISKCTVWNTHKEGINIEDTARWRVADNDVSWTDDNALPSEDFGISVFGNAASANHGVLTGNRVRRSGKAGIAFAGSVQLCQGNDNNVTDANLLGEAFAAGFLMYGGNCRNNMFADNYYYDSAAHAPFGFAEGPGSSADYATSNTFVNCRSFGVATKNTSLTAGSCQAGCVDGLTAYTVTASGITGDLGSYVANGSYKEDLKMVDFTITAQVTNRGSANGGLALILPFTNGAIPFVCQGVETVTGHSVFGIVNANSTFIACRFYDGTPPLVNGQLVLISGRYAKA